MRIYAVEYFVGCFFIDAFSPGVRYVPHTLRKSLRKLTTASNAKRIAPPGGYHSPATLDTTPLTVCTLRPNHRRQCKIVGLSPITELAACHGCSIISKTIKCAAL